MLRPVAAERPDRLRGNQGARKFPCLVPPEVSEQWQRIGSDVVAPTAPPDFELL